MLTVQSVSPGGIGDRAGIRAGDRIEKINGIVVRDVIDYQFLTADERLDVLVVRTDGVRKHVRIALANDASLGLAFPPIPVRRCRNKCIFCFVDQMPAGCRKSLYVKDDDYRASFLFGNYITLGNLREDDWERIFAQRLSPLYLSVHATEPELRRFILNNTQAPDIMTALRRLAAGGIRMHTQIVLCPGVNDGGHLLRTVDDLASLFPAVQSIAAVPVGLTSHRTGLFPLRKYRPSEAGRIIDELENRGRDFRRKIGTRLVFASDELYITAGRIVPQPAFYEDFPQIENGVGLVADFLRDARRVRLPAKVPPTTLTMITGVSFKTILDEALGKFKKISGLTIRVVAVKNSFFGKTVTVAGLLTGSDIMKTIQGRSLGQMLLIPASCLKDEEALFLDDRTLQDVERAAGVPVRIVQRLGDVAKLLREGISERTNEVTS